MIKSKIAKTTTEMLAIKFDAPIDRARAVSGYPTFTGHYSGEAG